MADAGDHDGVVAALDGARRRGGGARRSGRRRSPRSSTAATRARATSSPWRRSAEFHAEHERRNGYARPDAPVEVVALRARAQHRRAARRRRPPGRSTAGGPSGPAVIAEADCTIVVPDGWVAEPGAAGALVVTRSVSLDAAVAAGADLAADGRRRRDGRGAAPRRVQPEHQGARRLLGCAVHRRRRAARPGRAHPGAPRVDAGVGAGCDRRLRRRRRARGRAGRAQRSVRRRHPPQRHHARGAVLASTDGWSGGRPTAPTTPTSAVRRPARSRPTPWRSRRRVCASRRSCSRPRCGRCCSPTPARRTSAPATSTPRSAPTPSASTASPRSSPPARRSTRSLDYGERRMRAALAALPDGAWSFADVVDSCGPSEELGQREPARITVAVTVAGDEITFDFTGTDHQRLGNVNAVEAVTVSAVSFALRSATDPTIPANGGALRPLTVIAPAGTIVAAQSPGRRRRRQRRGEPAHRRRVPRRARPARARASRRRVAGDDEQRPRSAATAGCTTRPSPAAKAAAPVAGAA